MSDEETTTKEGIIRLKGSNYRSWSRQMEYKLRGKGLWKTIEGPIPEQPFRDAYLNDFPTPEAAEVAYKKDKAKWKTFNEKSAKAMDKIYSSISESVRPTVEKYRTPKEMWDRLSSIYGESSTARGNNTTQIRAELGRMTYTFGTDIDTHFAKAQRLINTLYEIEGKVNDEEITSFLFLMMPPEMRYYKSALRETMENKALTYDQVMTRFRTEILTLEREVDTNEAMNTKTGQKSKSNNANKKRRGKYCNFCETPGHLEEDCFKKDPKKRTAYEAKRNQTLKKRSSEGDLLDKAAKDKKKKVSKRSVGVSELDIEELKMVSVTEVSDEEEMAQAASRSPEEEEIYYVKKKSLMIQSLVAWLADSGCTKHMAANKSYFHAMRPLQRPTYVRVGNGEKISAEAIGDVVIHLCVKEKGIKTIRKVIIREVLYVPKLMTNLLSIRELGEVGISTTFQGRVKNDKGPLRGSLFDQDTNRTLATANLKGKQFSLDLALSESFTHFAFLTEPDEDSNSVLAPNTVELSDDSDTSNSSATETSDQESSEPEESDTPAKRQRRHNSKDEIYTMDSESSDEEPSGSERVTDQEEANTLTNEYETIETDIQVNPAEVSAFQNLWHHRLGHPNSEVLNVLASQEPFKDASALKSCTLGMQTCRSCAEGKGHRSVKTSKANAARDSGVERVSKTLEMVHADTSGSITPLSHPRKFRYFMLFLDDATQYLTAACLRRKCEGLITMQTYAKVMEKQTGCQLKRFKTDNGTEFITNSSGR